MGQEERKREGRHGRDGKPAARPARQDAGAERCDAKQHPAEQLQHRCDRVHGGKDSEDDLAGGATRDPQEAHREPGCLGRQQRQDEAFSKLKGRLDRPKGAEQEEAGQAKLA
jgi:hypothetical protein